MTSTGELRARKGPLLIVSNASDEKLFMVQKTCNDCIQVPVICDCLAPVMMLRPLQLLVFHNRADPRLRRRSTAQSAKSVSVK